LGNAGQNGGAAGDLFVVVLVANHPFFKRDHADLLCEVPLSFADAALGTEIKVPGLKSDLTVKVPAGTQTATIFRLKGKGVTDIHSGHIGDQFVKVNVVVPKHLTKEQQGLLAQWVALEKKDPDQKGFFEKFGFKRGV
ncbi:MAG: DnaJ C-terminal domain-containing protein, partial [Candidatus Diapherotrites archaeon]|nr:DnaJ C-terminal domain-containing protein [Candidatus Diapherotrites archaeon]